MNTKKPVNQSDWYHLNTAIRTTFTPSLPINEESLFAGRISILKEIVHAVFEPGKHVILHGIRGVGESSLANVVKEKVFADPHFHVVKRNCTASHNYKLIWEHCFDEFTLEGTPASRLLEKSHNPYEIFKIIDGVGQGLRPVFIIDEFDRVEDSDSHDLMADTIKYLADYASNATIIIVGVGESVNELLSRHESIVRNTRQIHMPAMTPQELMEILDTRLHLLNMRMNDEIKSSIVKLSQGLPHYTHLIGQSAALQAASQKKMEISEDCYLAGVSAALSGADQSLTNSYLQATRSTKPTNLFKEVLLACALARCDERGYFSAASVKQPYSEIVDRSVGISDFARHLSDFTKTERGPVLIREGKPKSFEYKFRDSLMRPYITIRGVSEGWITPDQVPAYYPRS
jgi:Cdc6-like AAA superfamily ATPase